MPPDREAFFCLASSSRVGITYHLYCQVGYCNPEHSGHRGIAAQYIPLPAPVQLLIIWLYLWGTERPVIRQLGGVDAQDAVSYPPAAQVLAQAPGQRAYRGLEQVPGVDSSYVGLKCSPHGRDGPEPPLVDGLQQGRLWPKGIYGINHYIRILVQNRIPVGVVCKQLERLHLGLRIYIQDPVPHSLYLGDSYGGLSGTHMPVYVGLGNLVKIHQGKVTHTAPGQHLGRPGPYGTKPENGYPRLLELLERVITNHLYDSGKTVHNLILIIPKVIINIKNIYNKGWKKG